MLRRSAIFGLFFALVACSGLLLRGAAVHTEMVQYPSGNETISGYLALPAGPGRHPGLLVIHEWWGLNDWVKEQTQRFAELGYVALAVDLYRGKSATTPEEAHILMRGLPDDRGLRDLEAAYAYLASRPDVRPTEIGDIGWCMGGGWSIKLAEDQPKLAACVVNYGPLPTDPANIKRIHAPVLGNFGAEDQGIPPASVKEFERAMQAAGKTVDIKIYDGAGHAFQNPLNKAGYRPEAAENATKRTDAFFQKYLQ